MSDSLRTLLEVIGVWIFIVCVILPVILTLAAWYEQRGLRVEDMLLTPAECEQELLLGLEDAYWGPAAPDPKWLA